MAENVNVEELMNSKNPMFGGCSSIEKAIAEFYESGQQNFAIITEMLDRELKEDAEVIAPVAIPENFFGGMNPEDIYATLAKDAVEGFKVRIDDGDKFAEKMYREALEILESIQ